MIIEFSIKNFFSFKNKNTFSMIASTDKSLKENIVLAGNENLLKTTALYGSNASGKSNLFKALANISYMITQSNFFSPDVQLPIVPFKLNKQNIKEPSEFEIKFIVESIKYTYGFKADSNNIYDEYLHYYPKGRKVRIFERKNINEYIFGISDTKKGNDIKLKNTSNKFFISTATTWNFEKTKPAFDFITQNLGIILNMDQVRNYSYNKYYNDENGELKSFALKFLNKADFNIKGYSVTEDRMTEEKMVGLPEPIKTLIPIGSVGYRVNTKHIVGEDEFEFDINEESLGTQMLFSIIPVLKDVLENKKVLIIDEIDKSLHPNLVKYIVQIFNDSEINKYGAQLIFNTHDTNLLDLDLLRRDQIWFAEKDEKTGSSEIYPLDDFSVRKNENIEKGYLQGRYGAIPFLDSDFSFFLKD